MIDLTLDGAAAALLVHAVVTDARAMRIANATCGALAAIAVLRWALVPGAAAAAPSALAAAAAVLAGGFLLFARGVVGGGDVKLLTAGSLLLGAAATPRLLLLTSLLGGVLTLLLLLGRRWPALGAMLRKALPGLVRGLGVPYGPAISAAALWLLVAGRC